ncbi:MAG: signal transduction histidine kinase [Planctomycetota bacterium]|jgi:signal transduction histidine kinase
MDDPSLLETDKELLPWLDEQTERLAPHTIALYLLDPAGELLYRSADLANVDKFVLASNERFNLKVEEETVGRAFASLTPIPLKSGRIGFLGRVHFYFRLPAADAPKPKPKRERPDLILASDSPLYRVHREGRTFSEESDSHYHSVRLAIDSAVALLAAAILGFLVSWFLSRRIVRLARQTEITDEAGIPGPFKVGGGDEIAALSNAMNEMSKRIRALVGGLEKRDAARREWVAQVSHDLRTPLTSLRVCLDRATMTVAESSNDDLKNALDLAQHDARRLQSLSEDLLDAARLEAGAPLEFELVLPREVLRDAMKSDHPLAESRGIELSMSTEGSIEEYGAEGARLLRACENLLRNTVRHAAGKVEAGVQSIDKGISFWIRDDGAGFGGAIGPRRPRIGSPRGWYEGWRIFGPLSRCQGRGSPRRAGRIE